MQLAKFDRVPHVVYSFAVTAPGSQAHTFSVRYSEAKALHAQLVDAGLVTGGRLPFPPAHMFSSTSNNDSAVHARGEAMRVCPLINTCGNVHVVYQPVELFTCADGLIWSPG